MEFRLVGEIPLAWEVGAIAVLLDELATIGVDLVRPFSWAQIRRHFTRPARLGPYQTISRCPTVAARRLDDNQITVYQRRMNYRHAYHAGNFADVVKHAVLALLIRQLQAKEKPFRVIDTHAGIGLYDLSSPLAAKTAEWRNGIGRLLGPDLAAVPRSKKLAEALSPYLDTVRALNPDGRLRLYPGSPLLARRLLRPVDRLTAVELHPDDFRPLGALFAGDVQVKAIELDGWLALGSFVPPKERRGLVLVDPPFEAGDEFRILGDHFEKAVRRWPTGMYALWYPVKDIGAVKNFHRRLYESGIPKLLASELWVRERSTPDRFNGTGLVICNPPFRIEETLESLLTGLVPILGEDAGAGRRLWWIRAEE